MAQNYDVTYTINAKGNFEVVNNQAISINKNMKEAATAAGNIPRAAQAALSSTGKGLVAENRDYGKARGITGQTGSGSRDFAKEAEGLGGLVRLYATFAANIFAVGAAFEAFDKAFKYEHLVEASKVLAVETGKNLAGVANSLKELSDGALTDKAAQKLANYGSVAGFTTEQMKRFVVVAKGASFTQGLDVGDTIDKLVTGAAKMQPKILMQIGLMTKARDTTQEYANSVGKTTTQLTTFEKQQAFANALLKEGEEKFGAVANALDVAPFEKFTTVLQDRSKETLNLINKALVPLLDFFTNNPTAMMAAMGAAFVKMAITAIPALSQIGEAAKKSAAEQKENFEKIKASALNAQGVQSKAAQEGLENERRINAQSYSEAKTAYLNKKELAKNALQDYQGSNATLNALKSGQNVTPETLNRAIAGTQSWADKGNANAILANNLLRQQSDLISENLTWESKKADMLAQQNSLRSQGNKLASIPVSTSTSFEIQKARAEMRAYITDQVAMVSQTAGVQGQRVAWTMLGESIKNVRDKYDIINKSSGALGEMGATVGKSWVTATTAIKGGFGILTTGLMTGLSVLSPWLMAIGLISAAVYGLAEMFGGFNKSIGDLENAQKTYSKALDLSIESLVKYQEKQINAKDTTESFLGILSYSSNLFSGTLQGLKDISSAMQTYAEDTGILTAAWQKMLGWVGKDVLTTQANQLRKTFTMALASVPPEEQQKVKDAILRSFPGAADLKEVNDQLNSMSAMQMAIAGSSMTKNLDIINTKLKSQVDNIKTAQSAWKGLGDEFEKYFGKEEVKDPKLKGIYDQISTIFNSYKEAQTEQERVNILAGAGNEIAEKLRKLGEERNLDFSSYIEMLKTAKQRQIELTEETKKQGEARKQDTINAAQAALDAEQAAKDKQSNLGKNLTGIIGKERLDEINKKIAATEGTDINFADANTEKALQDMKLARAKEYKDKVELLNKLEQKAKEDGYLTEAQGFANMLEEEKLATENFSDFIRKAHEYLGKDIVRNYSNVVTALKAASSTMMFLKSGESENEMARLGHPEMNPAQRAQRVADIKAQQDALAKMSGSPAHTQTQKVPLDYELAIKAANAQIAANKIIEGQERDILGYVTDTTLQNQVGYNLIQAHATQAKEIADIEKRYEDDKKRNFANAAANYAKAKQISEDKYATETKGIVLEFQRQTALNQILQYEKDILAFKKLSLDVQSASLSAQIAAGLISDRNAESAKIELEYKKANLELESERVKVAARSAMATSDELKAGIDRDTQIIGFKQQQLDIQNSINQQVAKYKADIADAARTEELMTHSLQLQVEAQNTIFSESFRANQVLAATNAIITTEAAKYLEISKNLTLESDKQAALGNAQINIENKVLELKRAQFLADSKDPNADVGKTVQAGFDIMYEDAKKKAVGLAQAVVNGITSGINDSVDLLFTKLASGDKINFGDMAKTFGASFKKSVFEGFASQVKVMFAGLFGGKASESSQLKDALMENVKQQQAQLDKVKQSTDSLDNLSKVIDKSTPDLKGSIDNLITSLKDLTVALNGKISDKSGDNTSTDNSKDKLPAADFLNRPIELIDKNLTDVGESVSTFTKVSDEAESAMDMFSKSLVAGGAGLISFLGSLSSLVSGGSGGSGGVGGSISGIIDLLGKGWKALSSSFGDSGNKIATDTQGMNDRGPGSGTPATTDVSSLLGTAAAGAGTGAMIGSLAGQFFGNSRNQAGMQLGGAAGGAIGSFWGPAGKIVGSAIGSAIGSLIKSGGGKMSEGYASSGKVGEKGAAFDSHGDTTYDKTLKEIADNTTSSYDKLIKAFGGTAGSFGYQSRLSTDPKGTAKGGLSAQAFLNGKSVYTSSDSMKSNAIGRTQEEVTAALELESKRAILSALTQSDLPGNVTAYFKDVTTEAIQQMSADLVDQKLDFGSVLGTIAKQREQIASAFGEDLYNLTEDDLKKFSKGAEKLSETFNRLLTTFNNTDKFIKSLGVDVKTAFGKIGLASADARESLIAAAGGADEFASKATFFIENFTTAIDQGSNKFIAAVETMQMGFKALGMEIPRSMEAYKTAMHDAVVAGNYELVNSLLNLAPAFNDAVGAIDKVIASIHDLIGTTISDIEDMVLSSADKYTKYAQKANQGPENLDKYMGMSNEELLKAIQSGELTPDKIDQIVTDTVKNVNTAVNSVPTDERAAYASRWIQFLDTLDTNSSLLLKRITDMITVPVPDTTALKDSVAGSVSISEDSMAIMNDGIVGAFTTGSDIIAASITDSFSNVGISSSYAGIGSVSSPDSGITTVSDTMGATLDAIAKNSSDTQQIIFDQQVATLSALADKLLGAADNFVAASADLRNTAQTPQNVNVNVNLDVPQGMTADVGTEVGAKNR